MHVMTKVTLGLGAVLFVISGIAVVIGGVELDSALEEVTPNSVGYEYWTGDTSTEFNGELKWSSVYFVFVEEGYEVDVEVSGGGYFESCEEYGDCDDFDVFPGYDYIGDLEVDGSGDYEVDFSETEGRIVDVKITEDEIPRRFACFMSLFFRLPRPTISSSVLGLLFFTSANARRREPYPLRAANRPTARRWLVSVSFGVTLG